MQRSVEPRVSAAAGTSILRAAAFPDDQIRELETRGEGSISVSHAMALVSAVRALGARGVAREDALALVPALATSDLALPEAHAEVLAGLARRLSDLGLERNTVWTLTAVVAGYASKETEAAARDVEDAARVVLDAGFSGPGAGELLSRVLQDGRTDLASRTKSALASRRSGAGSAPPLKEAAPRFREVQESPRRGAPRTREGGNAMGDSDRRNGSGPTVGSEKERERERLEREREVLDREREKMERERERADREREKLDRERERLDRLQEALEERLERQEERLQELEEELEERMETLQEAADDLDDIEVEGIDGVREMLDVVSERLPHLMRGIHDSVYSPDKLQATAESFAAFYKTLTESGMPAHLAAQLTQEHFAKLDREVRAQMEHQRPGRRERRTSADARDSLGPDFDPLGPNFDPLKGRGWAERPPAPRPGEPMQPPEPDRRSTP